MCQGAKGEGSINLELFALLIALSPAWSSGIGIGVGRRLTFPFISSYIVREVGGEGQRKRCVCVWEEGDPGRRRRSIDNFSVFGGQPEIEPGTIVVVVAGVACRHK